jgi:hypothetical protein
MPCLWRSQSLRPEERAPVLNFAPSPARSIAPEEESRPNSFERKTKGLSRRLRRRAGKAGNGLSRLSRSFVTNRLTMPGRARVFKIAFMLRRDGEFMTLEEFDHIAVYLNHIHKTPLSESGPGGPSQLSKGLFLLEVKGSVNPSKPAFFKAEI